MKPSQFVTRDSLRSALTIAFDWLAIFAIAHLNVWFPHPLLYLVSVWAIGIFQFALGETMLHEAAHHNLFEARKLHDRLDFLYALPFGFTLNTWRIEHREHHRAVNAWATAPDRLISEYADYNLGTNWFWTWFVRPITGYAGIFYLAHSVRSAGWRDSLRVSYFWGSAIAVFAVCGHLEWLLLYWCIPYFWCFASYVYWSEIEDHYNTKSGSRTNCCALSNWLTHNNGYHYIHHKYPLIPWYNLKVAHHYFVTDYSDSSSGFIDTYKQISNGKNQG